MIAVSNLSFISSSLQLVRPSRVYKCQPVRVVSRRPSQFGLIILSSTRCLIHVRSPVFNCVRSQESVVLSYVPLRHNVRVRGCAVQPIPATLVPPQASDTVVILGEPPMTTISHRPGLSISTPSTSVAQLSG
jgi:hypothetical protein